MNYEDYEKSKLLKEIESNEYRKDLLNYNTAPFHRVIEDMTFKNIKSLSTLLKTGGC